MKFISGKKLAMTQIWINDEVLAVTPVLAGPCVITQVKTKASDSYNALQLSYGNRKKKNIKKPQLGHYQKADVLPTYVKEFKTEEAATFKIGDVVSADAFTVGDIVNVIGVSKGRGFQGVVKRHHFSGHGKTHGNKDQERMSGSVGPKGPAHVFKGTRMAGRMGGDRVTVTNLEIAKVEAENNILYIKGAIPGAINGFVMIIGSGELKVNLKKIAPVSEEKVVLENESVGEVKEPEILAVGTEAVEPVEVVEAAEPVVKTDETKAVPVKKAAN